ncbi:unnamed protein product [Ilex paraguariensis]|uniref:Zinc finger Sec23/Sec24-type domain-containing protein n=1 Tax=Ilex paraguariensis TaxID=185542 RepID=A0ABC8U438_9AQUA
MAAPGGHNSLSDNMQNLQINRPNRPVVNSGGPIRPPPPFAQQPPPFSGAAPVTRPGSPAPPPPGVFLRATGPPSGPPQTTLPPNVAPRSMVSPVTQQPPSFAARPSPPPPAPGSFPLPMGGPVPPPSGSPPNAFPSGPRPGPYPVTTGSVVSPAGTIPGSISNGPPTFGSGMMQGGPRFPSAVSTTWSPPVGPSPPPTMLTSRPSGAPPHPPSMSTPFGSGPPSASAGPAQPAPPFSTPLHSVQPPPGSSPFAAPLQGVPPSSGSPYGPPTWTMQPRQVAPPLPIPGSSQPPRMFGMPPLPPQNQSLADIPPAMGHTGAAVTGPSKIDPNQIPHPIPSSSVILHETRQGNQANPPPPATSDYIVTDTGNCSPRYLRCTINQVPCTADLLTTSGMQLALLVQPFALPHPSEEPIQVVDFGESGPVRCSRCKGYINPFMKFIDQGRRFICNFCGFTDETPRDYHCNLGPDGRRRDADERPELCRGTVEFVATKEFMVALIKMNQRLTEEGWSQDLFTGRLCHGALRL